MIILLIILVIILVLLYNCNEHYLITPSGRITEQTPYSHDSVYGAPYITQCKNKKCSNSRCIISTMGECQDKCKTGCRYCNDGMYRCDML